MANEWPSTASAVDSSESGSHLVDGRTLRRRRNVDAVLDAVIALAGDGDLDPTAEAIAERAGVSHRSIYRYFDSRSELLAAAMSRGVELLGPVLLFDDVGAGPLDQRISKLVETRTAAYWQFRTALRAAFAQPDDSVRASLDAGRSILRAQVRAHFAPELSERSADQRAMLLALLDTPFQFSSLEYMTTEAALDQAQLAEALTTHLTHWLS